jgi:hypothetical protein
VGKKLNGTHQLLSFADDVNLLEDNIDTINKNTEILIDGNKEVGLEINAEKTVLLSHHKNAGQNPYTRIKTENVLQFRYLGATVPHQNWIQEGIKRRLNSGNACFHRFQNSCLLVCCLKT